MAGFAPAVIGNGSHGSVYWESNAKWDPPSLTHILLGLIILICLLLSTSCSIALIFKFFDQRNQQKQQI